MPRRPFFVLRFDRPLSPSSGTRANLRLASGAVEDLTFERVRVDPVERTLVFDIDRDLTPNTRYELRVLVPARVEERVTSFDGTPMTVPLTLSFWTRTTEPSDVADAPEVEPVPAAPCRARAVLAACGQEGACHSRRAPEGPPLGLVLDDDEGVQAAFRRVAVTGATAEEPAGSGQLVTGDFPYGLPLLARGNSSASYLLWTLLANPAIVEDDEVVARTAEHPSLAAPDCTDRPRSWLAGLVGPRMPVWPMPAVGHGAVSTADLRVLRRWIDGGGPSCGPDDK